MKKIFVKLSLCASLFVSMSSSVMANWKEINPDLAPKQLQLIKPEKYKVYTLDENNLKIRLWNVANTPEQGEVFSLPMPDGSMREFKVWETSMMPPELAALNPETKTFTATAVNDATVTAKLDFTLYGFHAMVFDGDNTSFIDPWDNYRDGYYLVHYKRDINRPANERMQCMLHNEPGGDQLMTADSDLPEMAHKTINGYQLRTYRLALSCSNHYARAVTGLLTPTKAQVLARMTTTMNRVNGVYEREFSITMVFTANQNALIFVTASGDPFNDKNFNANACNTENQIQCDNLIGFAGYDIGHVFTTGSGGLAALASVCKGSFKAMGTTGSGSPSGDAFDIDYVAHEMGHQFGSDHTFNSPSGGCGSNRAASLSYEPGSGSTIMAYAGLCDPDNVQSNSNPYFHAGSIDKILTYVNTTAGNCAVKTPTGNKLVSYAPFSPVAYSIPYLTPFELTAPIATDSLADSVVLYAWEQYDLGGSSGTTWATTTNVGPLFRSFNPSKSNVRVFPRIASVMAGNLNTLHEKAPTVARTMRFRCLYRNIRNNKGCVTIPDELITLTAVANSTGAGFRVTSQGTAGISYTGGSTQTITWNVVSTNAAPVSAANVDIYMSTNGGTAWQYLVGTYPNTGTASVVVPNPATNSTATRFKVKGANNVFFNVNSNNFTVTYNSSLPVTPTGVAAMTAPADVIDVYPVPATNVLNMSVSANSKAAAYNTLGQLIWEGNVNGTTQISVATWAKGMYYIRFMNATNGNTTVKPVIVQ